MPAHRTGGGASRRLRRAADPAIRTRPHREALNAERLRQRGAETLPKLRAQVRKELRDAGKTLADLEVEQEAQRRWAASLPTDHPGLTRQLIATMPSTVAPHRLGVNPLVEVHAVRGLEIVQAMEQALRATAPPSVDRPTIGRPFGPWCAYVPRGGEYGRSGRPSGRQVALALYESQALITGTPNLAREWKRLAEEDNRSLQWALGHPHGAPREPRRYETAVTAMHAMLLHTDATLLLQLNLRAFAELRELVGDPDLGRYCAIDGMFIPAAREQTQAKTPVERELLHRGLSIGFGTHGDVDCLGLSLVTVTCVKSNLPLAWLLRPANEREYTDVLPLVELILHFWPDCPMEFLAGDSEYDQDGDLSYRLEAGYAIHPVWYKRGEWAADAPHRDSGGVPSCSKHGHLKLKQSDGFISGAAGRDLRRSQGIRDGELIDMDAAFHRWYCPKCNPKPRKGDWTYTRFLDHPRLYAWLPWEGDHWRVGLREAMGHRRNSSESINATLKAWGIGLPGKAGAFWCNNDADFEWLVGGALFANTARRLAHRSGAYARSLKLAADAGLTEPETAAQFTERQRQRLRPDATDPLDDDQLQAA